MTTKETYKLESISCFCFNEDFSQAALSPNDNRILIYQVPKIDAPFSTWKLLHSLKKHDSIVSSIDWSSVNNFIVSCGHDRNAYVWNYDEEKSIWNPTLVILRINRSANYVQWNSNGTKFAVASSAKQVPVCRYEQNNNWWVSKMIKKHKSTVLSLNWHPNNIFLITGSCDFKCRIFSAFIDDLDSFDDESQFEKMFPKQNKFGALLVEIDCAKSWVEDVCFSPCGMGGVFVSHDPAITFFRFSESAENKVEAKLMKLETLPFRTVVFLDTERVVAAGHDYNPILFKKKSENEWVLAEKIDKETEDNKSKVSGFAANKALFQTKTTQGDNKGVVIKTKHKNQIVGISKVTDSSGDFQNSIFTCGIDGNVFYWKM